LACPTRRRYSPLSVCLVDNLRGIRPAAVAEKQARAVRLRAAAQAIGIAWIEKCLGRSGRKHIVARVAGVVIMQLRCQRST